MTASAIAAGEVHVWRATLDGDDAVLARLEALLADDERERADAFRFERDRRRWVAGRGLLRTLLGRCLDAAPAELRFDYEEHGRPVLAGGGPTFNLSHSGGLALYAVSAELPLGIDVELAHQRLAGEGVAESFFSPTEVAELRSLPAAEQDRAFLACWTRKEAFIKARGDGLSLPLHSFDVSLAPGRPPALLRTGWSRREPSRWALADLSDRRGGYVAALAVRGHGWRLVRHDLVPSDLPKRPTIMETA